MFKILQRIAWNLPYRVRKKNSKEVLVSDDIVISVFDDKKISSIYVEEIIDHIPSDKGKYIIRKTIVDGLTEKEVAAKLNMTQQGVHKCKKKNLEILRQQKYNLKNY